MAHATQRSHQAPGDPETRQVQHPAMKGWPSPKEGGQAMLHNGHLMMCRFWSFAKFSSFPCSTWLCSGAEDRRQEGTSTGLALSEVHCGQAGVMG